MPFDGQFKHKSTDAYLEEASKVKAYQLDAR